MLDSKSSGLITRAGSTPAAGTKFEIPHFMHLQKWDFHYPFMKVIRIKERRSLMKSTSKNKAGKNRQQKRSNGAQYQPKQAKKSAGMRIFVLAIIVVMFFGFIILPLI